MGETYWPKDPVNLSIPMHTIYAQTFTPLWSHDLDKIRFRLELHGLRMVVKVSIQYLKPDGTPVGIDLSHFTADESYDPWFTGTYTYQRKVTPIRLVAGINYAFLIHTLYCLPSYKPITWYMPPPSAYPRGKLIKSEDDGATWDTTDIGDLFFAEYGDPPLVLNPWTTPIANVAVTEISQNNYKSNACIRVATTDPCFLRIHITDKKPTPIEIYRATRGGTVMCLEHYTFIAGDYEDQKEKWDSLYHTFYIGGLKEGEPYWITFTATTDFIPSISRSPIFHRLHPEAPPFTTIRRPYARGDICHIANQRGDPCPQHYLNLDEATPDEDTTYIYPWSGATCWQHDLYNIPNLPPEDTAPIEEVHLTCRVRRVGGYGYAARAQIVVKTNSTEAFSANFQPLSTGWQNKHWHLHTNPITGLPWTTAEINDLQIGIRLGHYWGVGWNTNTQCTQLFCKIIHKCEAYQ